MSFKVNIPPSLRRLTNQRSTVTADCATVEGLIRWLDSRYPGMRDALCGPVGFYREDEPASHVTFYLKGKYIDGRKIGHRHDSLKNINEVDIEVGTTYP